jgi:hypothetical protein
MQKGQNDQDDSDHDQGMDPASAIRPVVIPGTPTEETKQPENKQDYDNSPQHEISPFDDPLKDLLDGTQSFDRVALA